MFHENKTCQSEQESKRMDDIIRDTIIVSKIKEREVKTFQEIEEGLLHDGHLEKEQIAAEYEAIVKKQLQMLQADERGRQALQNEIVEIRSKQDKRADALKTRAKALEIEKERAKRIASRPPPLPRSVRMLLKEQAKKDSELMNADVFHLEEILEDDIENLEDKENIDEEYLAEKRKMQEEWDKKAKKRFNEALKKDRQKQEHDAILKDIENAERLNRRQMARNVSEPTGKVPNYLPDKLHHAERQVVLEDAVENIFKKKNPKEHAVEDLDGYQDKWEAKYKQIDSVSESKMIDCVPNFVKENYSYLLQEETTLQCGKRFSGLDDSTDDLNVAYIESPPADILNNSKEIDAVIRQLDQMRVELNEAYEKEFKPLLEEKALPVVVTLDKSVETDILKLPTEDKAVEVERTPLRKQAPLSSRSVQVDIMQGGVMSYQRRNLGNMYTSHSNNSGRYLPESFTYPSDTPSEVKSPRSALESWSSSSYWSLPSKHGLPNVCKFCDSPGCTIPLVEDEKLHRDCIPLRKGLGKQSIDVTIKSPLTSNGSVDESVKERQSLSDELHLSSVKSKLASYIQLVADKYLKKSTFSPEALRSSKEVPKDSDQTSPKVGLERPTAFSKFKFPEFVESSDEKSADTDTVQTSSVSSRKQSVDEETSAGAHDETRRRDYDPYALLTNMNSSSEDELLKNCQEIIAKNISEVFSPDNKFKIESADVSYSSDLSASPDITTEQHYKKESLTGYVYHDLSTIPEMDSILTNDTKGSSLNETQGSLGKKLLPKKTDLEEISPDEVDTTSASLVDVPVSEVSEIAKGIRFIRKPTPEPDEMNDASEESIPLISSTLSNLQTPSSVVIPKHQISTPGTNEINNAYPPLISGYLTDDQVSNFSPTMVSRTFGGESDSNDIRTPSPVSTLKSVSSTKSLAFPYSSSLRDSKITHSPPTSTSTLSKHFQDISSIKHVSETASKLSEHTPIPVQMEVERKIVWHESSPGTFMPMTPHSYLSTPGEINEKQRDHNFMKKSHLASQKNKNILADFQTPDSNADSFKPLTPHSDFSDGSTMASKYPSVNAKPFSPRKGSYHASHIEASSHRNIDDSSGGSFKPLSLISNVSTPKDTFMKHANIISNEKDVHISDERNEEYQYENTADSNNFQPMTPHTYLSSISSTTSKHPSGSAKNFYAVRDDQQTSRVGVSSHRNIDDSSGGSFKPLSLISNVSTPKDTFMKHANVISNEKDVQISDERKEEYEYENTADSNNFQPMTPHSYLSSPSDILALNNKLHDVSTEKELKEGYMNLSLKSPNSFSNKAVSPTYGEQGKVDLKNFTSMQLGLNVKDLTNSSKDIENYRVDGFHRQRGLSKDHLIKGDPSKKQMLSSKTSPKNYADAVKHTTKDLKKVASSGFVPHFKHDDFTLFKKNKIDENKVLFAAKNATDSKAEISSKYPNRSLHSKNNAVAFSSHESSLKDSVSIINNDINILPSVTSSMEHDRLRLSSHGEAYVPSTSPNPILQALAQQLASSSSKLRTPCATPSNGSSAENLSEMFVESKIKFQSTPTKSIEELIQETGILEEPSLTFMNTEMTIRPDSPEKSRLLSEGSLVSEDFKTPSSLQSAYFTPNTLDTPSGSASSHYYCDSPSMISFLKHEETCSASNIVESNFNQKKSSAKNSPPNEYKKRTERLWNNLEEVRTKKLIEEKKEQIRKNRLKMKSYSKKTTTTKKN